MFNTAPKKLPRDSEMKLPTIISNIYAYSRLEVG